jgi:hypothetical protein
VNFRDGVETGCLTGRATGIKRKICTTRGSGRSARRATRRESLGADASAGVAFLLSVSALARRLPVKASVGAPPKPVRLVVGDRAWRTAGGRPARLAARAPKIALPNPFAVNLRALVIMGPWLGLGWAFPAQ